MKRFKSILIGMLAIAFIGTVISCSEEAEANEATIENRVAELESWTSSLPKITGSIQYDMGMYTDDLDAADLTDDTEFRRVRIGAGGDVAGVNYKIELSAEGSSVVLKDAWLSKRLEVDGNFIKIITGQHKAPTSIDEDTLPGNITFMERATPSNIVASNFGSRRLGASAMMNIKSIWIHAGLFGKTHDETSKQWSINSRGMVSIGDGMGVGGSYARLLDREGSTDHSITYTDFPESQIDGSKFLTTGALTTQTADHKGASAYITQGPIHAHGEYFIETLTVSDTVEREFSGYYAQGGYMLTGENRTWNNSAGNWNRVTPDGDEYAIELAGRYSFQDYTDGTVVTGGDQTAMTIGVNVYNGPGKLGLNISQVSHDTANEGKDHTFIGLRAQVSF
jgi:phosphate-selective porin OprO/OprP